MEISLANRTTSRCRICAWAAAMMLLLCADMSRAQTASPAVATSSAANVTPVAVSLSDAIRLAQQNEPAFAAATADSKVAALDKSIARSALLPSAIYHNQALYTQPNGQQNQAGQGGTQAAPRFIANNAVREYASQGIVTETLGLQQWTAVKAATAASALAAAQLEVARRGLVATVVGLYYTALADDQRLAVAQRAAHEADDFTSLTGKRETAREGAHADTVKAQLQQQQRQRDLSEAQLAQSKSRLELAVLLFPNPVQPYTLEMNPAPPALPERAEIEAAAAKKNPDLAGALAAVRQSDANVVSARAAYLPELGLNFAYGIDAPQFATNGEDHVRNLGYSMSATLDIPVWDWLSTQHKVKQSEIRRDVAKTVLSATQRRLIANIQEFYDEATVARDQLASLDASATTAAESLRLTKLRYTGGESTVLEVVDAQNALTSAEMQREDGAVRYRVALANLQTLTGTL